MNGPENLENATNPYYRDRLWNENHVGHGNRDKPDWGGSVCHVFQVDRQPQPCLRKPSR